MIEKNVVILRIETGNPSGVVRYIQMLTEGMKHMNGIKVHIICLNTSLIFPKFEVTEDRIITSKISGYFKVIFRRTYFNPFTYHSLETKS